MDFEYVAIPDAEVPRAAEPTFEHALDTYASEANKTVSMWRAMTDGGARLPAALKGEPDPHHPRPPVLSERQFFVEFAGLDEPAVEELMPTGEKPGSRRMATSTSGWQSGGCLSSPRVRPCGG